MRLISSQYRSIYAVMIIIAFFIPAYNHTSAFHFFILAFGAAGADSEITLIDLMVVLLPLLLVPVAAVVILIRVVKRKPVNSILLGLPFFSLAFFFLIFSFDINRQVSSSLFFGLFTHMHIGFYLAAGASFLLLFSHSRKESLNSGTGGH